MELQTKLVMIRMTSTSHAQKLAYPLEVLQHKVALKSVVGKQPVKFQRQKLETLILCSNVCEGSHVNGSFLPALSTLQFRTKADALRIVNWKNTSSRYFDSIHLYITDGDGKELPEQNCDLLCTLEFVPK